MSHFDHIPAGKKEFYNKEKNIWELVDLKQADSEDLKIMLDEKDAEVKELRIDLEKSKKIIEKMNAKIIELESNASKRK